MLPFPRAGGFPWSCTAIRPPAAGRAPRPRTPDEALVELLYRPERTVVPELDVYPAHLPHQRTAVAASLPVGEQTFVRALGGRGVPAVHLVMATANTSARAFYDRGGFHEIGVPDPGPVTCPGRTTRLRGL